MFGSRQVYHLGWLIGLGLGCAILPAQAAILSDSSERRVQIRSTTSHQNQAPIVINPKPIVIQDSLQALITQKQRENSGSDQILIEERQRVSVKAPPSTSNSRYLQQDFSSPKYQTTYPNHYAMDSFRSWLNNSRFRSQQVNSYQQYLDSRLSSFNVPPLSQLLTTARSWERCGFEPYQLPPEYLWANVVPTLKLYAELKRQGILPASAEIRSVYRSPELNSCAGGAAGSKHLTAGAIDIWVPEYEGNPWQLTNLQEGLCQFWQYQGAAYDFGLGLYATGAIHLDTQGYRKWGFEHSKSNFCSY